MTSLGSRCYIDCVEESKISCKGVIQKHNLLDVIYINLFVHTGETLNSLKTGFRVVDHKEVTNKQRKRGLNYHLIKIKMCRDGARTLPLDI